MPWLVFTVLYCFFREGVVLRTVVHQQHRSTGLIRCTPTRQRSYVTGAHHIAHHHRWHVSRTIIRSYYLFLLRIFRWWGSYLVFRWDKTTAMNIYIETSFKHFLFSLYIMVTLLAMNSGTVLVVSSLRCFPWGSTKFVAVVRKTYKYSWLRTLPSEHVARVHRTWLRGFIRGAAFYQVHRLH